MKLNYAFVLYKPKAGTPQDIHGDLLPCPDKVAYDRYTLSPYKHIEVVLDESLPFFYAIDGDRRDIFSTIVIYLNVDGHLYGQNIFSGKMIQCVLREIEMSSYDENVDGLAILDVIEYPELFDSAEIPKTLETDSCLQAERWRKARQFKKFRTEDLGMFNNNQDLYTVNVKLW